MKVQVIPTTRNAGRQCYTFVDRKCREAYKVLTKHSNATRNMLESLEALGVDIQYPDDAPAHALKSTPQVSIPSPSPTNEIQ